MKELSITEKYSLFIIKENKKIDISTFAPYYTMSILMEMVLDGTLSLDEKNKIMINSKKVKAGYKKYMLNIIVEKSNKPLTIKKLVSELYCGINNKKMKPIKEELINSLLEKKSITKTTKKILFINKEVLSVNEEIFENVVEEIRSEFLEEGNITDEIIVLSTLLNETRYIKKVFSTYEKSQMKDRIKEIKKTDISKKVQIAKQVIDEMNTLMMVGD